MLGLMACEMQKYCLESSLCNMLLTVLKKYVCRVGKEKGFQSGYATMAIPTRQRMVSSVGCTLALGLLLLVHPSLSGVG